MATAAAAVVAKARRDVVAHFMAANAVRPKDAVAYAPGRRLEERMLDRLQRAGIVIETEPQHYYLDVAAYEADRRKRRRVVIVIAVLLTIGVAVAALLSSAATPPR